jgi:hypothetical protein
VDAELKACFFAVFLSKIALKMAMARIKLLRNKKEAQVRQMRREVAQLLEANQDQTARIRVTPRFDHPPASSSYPHLLLLQPMIVCRTVHPIGDAIVRVQTEYSILGIKSSALDGSMRTLANWP